MSIIALLTLSAYGESEPCVFGGDTCGSPDVCVYYSSNGYSRAADENFPNGFCLDLIPANAGEECSILTITDDGHTTEYTKMCDAGTYCGYQYNANGLTVDGMNGICLGAPEECTEAGLCGYKDFPGEAQSACFSVDEFGYTTMMYPVTTEAPKDAAKLTAMNVCLLPETPVIGDPCGYEDVESLTEYNINRPCGGGVCRPIAIGLPPTCRGRPATRCTIATVGVDPCASYYPDESLTCQKWDTTTGVFSPAAAESDEGFCLSAGKFFGEQCLLPIEAASDLLVDNVIASCADTYACVQPEFTEPVTTLCTVAAAVQKPCSPASPCEEGTGVCSKIEESGVIVATGDEESGVCLIATTTGMACTDVITAEDTDLSAHLVRSCPDGAVCGRGDLFATTSQAECLSTELPTTTTTTTSAGGSTDVPVEGGCASGDDCDVDQYCTGTDGALVTDGTGSCLPGADPGELCADSTGAQLAFCLSTEGCQKSGLWSKCSGEFQAGAESVFAGAAVALITSLLFY